jgi:hypothetical protein
VTVDHVNAGTGLQSLTVVGVPVNATVNIPPFTPGTFNPVTVTFTPTMPGQAVDFTLRAASNFPRRLYQSPLCGNLHAQHHCYRRRFSSGWNRIVWRDEWTGFGYD